MEISTYENGQPCWVDLGVADVPAAAEFYGALFGWDIEIGPPEAGYYSMAMLHGAPVAALGAKQDPGPPYWTTYLATDDLDQTIERVRNSSATIVVEPMDVMTAGRMAVIRDPGGAALSLWQAGDHYGAGRIGEPGTLCWAELTTRAVDESLAFYSDVFGLSATNVGSNHGDYFRLHTASGAGVAGLMPMVGDMWPAELPNHWMVYFAVADTDSSAQRCADLGGGVCVGPADIPNIGRFAVVNDPQGATFSLITPIPPAE
jgi:predicted enzyme related to lactoylglutathione lyase